MILESAPPAPRGPPLGARPEAQYLTLYRERVGTRLC